MVLNLVFTEGAGDTLHLGLKTIITFSIIIIGIILFEYFLIYKIDKLFYKRIISGKVVVIFIIIFVSVILSDKLTFAISDLYNKIEVTRHSKIFPLYQPLTIKSFMRKHFGFELDHEFIIDYNNENNSLNYPVKPLTRLEIDQYPNIVWIIIDAWRYDMFNKELTPNIWNLSRQALIFNNHYSGGNASRFGIFSLFYGVYAYNWHQFLGERQSPVFIDELINLGYDFNIISSTKLTFPEFRKTTFVNIPEYVIDNLEGELAEEKDPLITSTFLNWLNQRDTTIPFFSFLFYDAPHGPYSYPDKFEKYKPSNKNPNYLTIGNDDIVPLKNSYKNAIIFDDYEIGIVLRALKEKNLFKNSIILITGDHGEEFYESGFLGHTSAFSKEQTKVPLILHIPDKEPAKIENMTSHLDAVPTMLELLGYTSESSIYSQGYSLLKDRKHNFVVSSGWDNCAIINNENVLIFSYETYNLASFEVRDTAYILVDNYRKILKENRSQIIDVIKGFNEFQK